VDQCVCDYCRKAIPKEEAVWIGNAALPNKSPTWCLCQQCAGCADEHGDGG